VRRLREGEGKRLRKEVNLILRVGIGFIKKRKDSGNKEKV